MRPIGLYCTGLLCAKDVYEIYEASFKATGPLHISFVKGAFCLAVRATRLLSTIRELLLFWWKAEGN